LQLYCEQRKGRCMSGLLFPFNFYSSSFGEFKCIESGSQSVLVKHLQHDFGIEKENPGSFLA